jgi:hypothetical protein
MVCLKCIGIEFIAASGVWVPGVLVPGQSIRGCRRTKGVSLRGGVEAGTWSKRRQIWKKSGNLCYQYRTAIPTSVFQGHVLTSGGVAYPAM